MASEIVPPFKLDEDNDICDGKGRFTLFIEDFPFDFDVERRDAFARELCAVMNENHKRLCHAANGEGEADGNENINTNKGE